MNAAKEMRKLIAQQDKTMDQHHTYGIELGNCNNLLCRLFRRDYVTRNFFMREH